MLDEFSRARLRAREARFEDAPSVDPLALATVALYLQAARDSAVMTKAVGADVGFRSEKYILASIADACDVLGYTLVKKGSAE